LIVAVGALSRARARSGSGVRFARTAFPALRLGSAATTSSATTARARAVRKSALFDTRQRAFASGKIFTMINDLRFIWMRVGKTTPGIARFVAHVGRLGYIARPRVIGELHDLLGRRAKDLVPQTHSRRFSRLVTNGRWRFRTLLRIRLDHLLGIRSGFSICLAVGVKVASRPPFVAMIATLIRALAATTLFPRRPIAPAAFFRFTSGRLAPRRFATWLLPARLVAARLLARHRPLFCWRLDWRFLGRRRW
jgi:hypothetical protein